MSGLPPLIVLSGPSGVGKTTLVERLVASSGLPLRRAVTATTRPPRPGECDGIDYHFWTVTQFHAAVDAGRMLEHAVVHGRDCYGTPCDEVDAPREAGVAVVLVIDVQGADQVRRKSPPGLFTVFVAPPSFDALRQRLEARGSEDAARLARRLETARAELERAREFDACVVNEELSVAVAELEALIRARLTGRPVPA